MNVSASFNIPASVIFLSQLPPLVLSGDSGTQVLVTLYAEKSKILYSQYLTIYSESLSVEFEDIVSAYLDANALPFSEITLAVDDGNGDSKSFECMIFRTRRDYGSMVALEFFKAKFLSLFEFKILTLWAGDKLFFFVPSLMESQPFVRIVGRRPDGSINVKVCALPFVQESDFLYSIAISYKIVVGLLDNEAEDFGAVTSCSVHADSRCMTYIFSSDDTAFKGFRFLNDFNVPEYVFFRAAAEYSLDVDRKLCRVSGRLVPVIHTSEEIIKISSQPLSLPVVRVASQIAVASSVELLDRRDGEWVPCVVDDWNENTSDMSEEMSSFSISLRPANGLRRSAAMLSPVIHSSQFDSVFS